MWYLTFVHALFVITFVGAVIPDIEEIKKGETIGIPLCERMLRGDPSQEESGAADLLRLCTLYMGALELAQEVDHIMTEQEGPEAAVAAEKRDARLTPKLDKSKMKNEYMRFGKRKPAAIKNEYMRFGKAAPKAAIKNEYMRFGKRK